MYDYGNNTAQGSPPRVRGKGPQHGLRLQGQGITPAYAGKSKNHLVLQRLSGDHPRVCGEKASDLKRPLAFLGSPPRVRGKACIADDEARAAGITPAYAGKSDQAGLQCGRVWDHPRVCGEKTGKEAAFLSKLGSPPRVRGKGTTRSCQRFY